MSQTWGRPDSAGTWPRPKPVSTLATALLAVVAGAAIGAYQYAATWTPLQRWYLPSYLRSAVMAGLGVTTTRPLSAAPGRRREGEPPGPGRGGPTGHHRHGAGDVCADRDRGAPGGSAARVAGPFVQPPAAARVPRSLDLPRSDAHGSADARGVGRRGRLPGRPADRDPEGPRALARTPARTTVAGPGAADPGAIQPPHARRRHRLPAAAARVAAHALGPPPARHRVEPSPPHGRLRHRQVRPHPAAVAAGRARVATRPSSTIPRANSRRSSTHPTGATSFSIRSTRGAPTGIQRTKFARTPRP